MPKPNKAVHQVMHGVDYNFYMTPVAFMEHANKHFSHLTANVFHNLCYRANNTTKMCFQSIKTIADDIGASEKWVGESLRDLEKKKLIVIKVLPSINGKFPRHEYWIQDPKLWDIPHVTTTTAPYVATTDGPTSPRRTNYTSTNYTKTTSAQKTKKPSHWSKVDSLLTIFNELNGKNYQVTTWLLKLLSVTLKDHTMEDCEKVIRYTSKAWKGDQFWDKHVNPHYLFGSKFAVTLEESRANGTERVFNSFHKNAGLPEPVQRNGEGK